MYGIEDFLPVYGHFFWSSNPQPSLAALDVQYSYDDVIVYDDAFVSLPR